MASANPHSPSASVLDVKRERGKVAQREYRKRHASKFQSLKEETQKLSDENQKLKDAIREISKIAARSSNVPYIVVDAIAQAREVAGLGHEDVGYVEALAGQRGDIQAPVLQSIESASESDQALSRIMTAQGRSPSSAPGYFYQRGRFSPPLGRGLWLDTDRIIRIFDTPADLTPYLGEGQYSVAGCLYWACVNRTVSLWQVATDGDAKEDGEKQKAENCLDRLFDHSSYLTNRAFLVALAQARLEYRKLGYIERRTTSSETPEEPNLADIRARIEDEYAKRGESLQWWKDAQQAAAQLEKHLEPYELDELKVVAQGHGSAAAVKKYGPLIELLSDNHVCFGDGPRWHALHISMTIGSWLQNEDIRSIRV